MTTTQPAPGRAQIENAAESYRNGSDQPLAGYAGSMVVYAASVAAAVTWLRASGRRSEDFTPADVVLGALATHKLSRTLSKSAVTSPLRAPVTRFEGDGGPGEVTEKVRSEGNPLRHAIGELLSCPFCLDVWVATGLAVSFVRAPRATRFVAGVLSSLTGADFLHLGYAKAQEA